MSILLPEGKYLADKMAMLATAHQIELINKFRLGAAMQAEKGRDSLIYGVDGLEYDPKFGLTESEFKELNFFLSNDAKLEMVGQEEIEIEIEDNAIHFYSQGDLDDLNNLWIDLKDSSLHFFEYSMLLSGYRYKSTIENSYKTPVYGYEWSYEYPAILGTPNHIQEITGNSTIGNARILRMPRLEKTMIFLSSTSRSESGQPLVYELTVYF